MVCWILTITLSFLFLNLYFWHHLNSLGTTSKKFDWTSFLTQKKLTQKMRSVKKPLGNKNKLTQKFLLKKYVCKNSFGINNFCDFHLTLTQFFPSSSSAPHRRDHDLIWRLYSVRLLQCVLLENIQSWWRKGKLFFAPE